LAEKAIGDSHRARRDELLAIYRERYAGHMLDRSRPYAGVPELLAALVERAIPLAVLSNKPEPATQKMIGALFPTIPWRVVAGDRADYPRKPDPARALAIAQILGTPPDATTFVGDTAVDVATARAANMIAVGVTWGFRDRAELHAAGAQRILSHPADLIL
jgi:phosphoglycolate phosphatase